MRMQLAQFDIARLLHPFDHPLIAEFVAGLDEINRLAERSTGFVWRLTIEAGNATEAQHPWSADPLMPVNMSVWETPEDLKLRSSFRTSRLLGEGGAVVRETIPGALRALVGTCCCCGGASAIGAQSAAWGDTSRVLAREIVSRGDGNGRNWPASASERAPQPILRSPLHTGELRRASGAWYFVEQKNRCRANIECLYGGEANSIGPSRRPELAPCVLGLRRKMGVSVELTQDAGGRAAL